MPLFLYNFQKSYWFINGNNRSCTFELNNHVTVAVVEQCAVVSRLRLFAPSLLDVPRLYSDYLSN